MFCLFQDVYNSFVFQVFYGRPYWRLREAPDHGRLFPSCLNRAASQTRPKVNTLYNMAIILWSLVSITVRQKYHNYIMIFGIDYKRPKEE